MPFDIPHLLYASGGQVVGKIRLQKTVYLLDQLGLNSGFAFEYHHYGPYSAELADATDDCIAFDRISETIERRVSDGVRYSIFRAEPQKGAEHFRRLGNLPIKQAESALRVMNK